LKDFPDDPLVLTLATTSLSANLSYYKTFNQASDWEKAKMLHHSLSNPIVQNK